MQYIMHSLCFNKCFGSIVSGCLVVTSPEVAMVADCFLVVDLAECSFGSCRRETDQESQTKPPFPGKQ